MQSDTERGKGRVHRHRFARRSRQPAWVDELAARLTTWTGVRARPLFQWAGFFARGRCFAALPRTLRSNDLLVRINAGTRASLLASGRARPYIRGSRTGWVRIRVPPAGPTSSVLRILKRAHSDAQRGAA